MQNAEKIGFEYDNKILKIFFECYFVKRFLMIFNENYLFLFIIPKNGEKIKQKRGRAGGTVA